MENQYQLDQVNVRLCLKPGDPVYSSKPVNTPNAAIDAVAEVLKELDREWLCVINVDNVCRPINFNVVSIGTINAAPASVSNIFKSAILSNANRIILLHTHPSGKVVPSIDDVILTKKVVEAGKILDIDVLDHIIVGSGTNERYSFKEHKSQVFEVREEIEI